MCGCTWYNGTDCASRICRFVSLITCGETGPGELLSLFLFSLFFFFFFCANPPVNSVRIINPMIEDTLRMKMKMKSCLLVGCLTSHGHASVSQGRICSDNFTCCHTEMEVANQPFHLTQSQCTDTGPTSPSTDPITPGRVATAAPIFKSLV